MTGLTDALSGMGMAHPMEAVPPSTLPREISARPDPQWVRGRCPQCGGVLVSSMYWLGPAIGYGIAWECWNRRAVEQTGQTVLSFSNELGDAITSFGTGWAKCDYARIL